MNGVVGVDLGGTWLRVAAADRRGGIRHRLRQPTRAERGPAAVMEDLLAGVQSAAHGAGLDPRALDAVVVGIPGPIDLAHGVVRSPPNLPGWRNVRLAEWLRRRLRVPTYLENDANLAAFGELRRGAGVGARNLIYVTISTGIGGGLILDGALFRGSTGTAGEVGHMIAVPNGPVCNCGRRGCLEAVASGTAIAKQAQRALARGARTRLRALRGAGRNLSAELVVEAARAGDRVAIAILAEAGGVLGRALGSLINLLNPELIILGGGVSQAGPLLTGPMRASLKQSSFPEPRAAARIVRARLGQDAGLVGAVDWACQRAVRMRRFRR